MKTKITFFKTVFLITALFALTILQAQTLVAHYEFNGDLTSSGGTYSDDLTPHSANDGVTTFSPFFTYTNDNNSNSNAAVNIALTGATSGGNPTEDRPLHLRGTNNFSISGGSSRTYAMWIKVPAIGDNNNGIGLIDNGITSAGERFTMLLNRVDGNGGVTPRAVNVGVNGWGTSGTTAVAEDVWTFIAMTYLNNTDGSPDANGTISVYLTDGADVTTSDFSAEPGQVINTASTPLYIGMSINNFVKRGFIGDMADVRVYEGALSVAQINQVKNGSTLGVEDEGFAENELKVFPNTVTDYLNIKTSVSGRPHITVYDLVGKVVKKDFSEKIDMRDLPSGLYIINVRAGNKAGSLKIIKE
ncbi:LamG-like jellyroll fold domain-containing protein [Seonamhaeicola sp.]|uniref:LamG-like jellyroll fold domain-containing protein n=1 Tax=Seonamhaeicola sp. TaxID=1912245 RepID=UPI002622D5F7|nr:LamG-like jellyroll fold domain-containing protein [Seonamhaeicola sp.]